MKMIKSNEQTKKGLDKAMNEHMYNCTDEGRNEEMKGKGTNEWYKEKKEYLTNQENDWDLARCAIMFSVVYCDLGLQRAKSADFGEELELVQKDL